MIKKILVAVSGSDSSINASKYAIMFAKTVKAELYALYVIDTSTLNDLLMSKLFIEEESKEYEKNLEANGNRFLAYVSELAKSKALKINKVLKRGNISTQILETAEEEKIDVIILGGWDINKSKRDLISKAHLDVLMDANKPVLIIKDPEVEDAFKRFY